MVLMVVSARRVKKKDGEWKEERGCTKIRRERELGEEEETA